MLNKFKRRKILKLIFGILFLPIEKLFSNLMPQKDITFRKDLINKVISLPASGPWPTIDPFLFCVHHNDTYPSATKSFSPNASLTGRTLGNDFSNKDGWNMYHGETIPGFPKHPHRGFETLTIVEKGIIDHSDSLGARARYGDGDAQWLTAGDGINHSEMFPLFDQKNQNKIDFFQIWINLPSYNKRSQPNFEIFWNDDIPKISVMDDKGIEAVVELICGKYNDNIAPQPPPNSWAQDEKNQMFVWIIRLKEEGEFKLPRSIAGVNRSIYIPKDNKVILNNRNSFSNCMIELNPEKDCILSNESKDAKILLLQGKPINEPVYQYGPFVMNTRAEIKEAFDDYNNTGFGGWSWNNSDPIHGKYQGKFAKLINGKTSKPS